MLFTDEGEEEKKEKKKKKKKKIKKKRRKKKEKEKKGVRKKEVEKKKWRWKMSVFLNVKAMIQGEISVRLSMYKGRWRSLFHIFAISEVADFYSGGVEAFFLGGVIPLLWFFKKGYLSEGRKFIGVLRYSMNTKVTAKVFNKGGFTLLLGFR
jgi:hypothetical protein